MELRKILAKNVVDLRKQQGLSQLELARLLNISKQTVWRIETASNNIGIDTLEQLTKTLKIDAGALLGGDGGGLRAEIDIKAFDIIVGCISRALKMARVLRAHLVAA